MYNTQYGGLQPSHLDSDKLACELRSDIEHSFHKGHQLYKDQDIDCHNMPCYQGSLDLSDILLFVLKKILSIKRNQGLLALIE